MSTPTPEERALVAEMAGEIAKAMIAAAAPDLMKLIATARSDARVAAIGNLLSIEPMHGGTLEALEMPQQRDYRKECWNSVYTKTIGGANGPEQALYSANQAVKNFDETFPS